MLKSLRLIAALALALHLAACASLDASQASTPVSVRILAINDFHGNLYPPGGGIRIRDPHDPHDAGKTVMVPAGGAEYLATAVKALQRGHENHVFVAAGDLIGASPLLSALFHDEPTIEALSLMGLEMSAVGNHEFDAGVTELLRKQNGGCHPVQGCQGRPPFKGAGFKYLAASTWNTRTQQTLFPAYQIKRFDGIPVAFIGLTLKGTPDIVNPSGVAGLRFDDEADTVNRLVPELRAQGIEAIVVLIHEGGFPTGDYNECPGISGPIVDIVRRLDKAVDAVISGHTHRAYVCTIDGRLVTSADKYGTVVSAIDLKIDRNTRDVVSAKANNVIVRDDAYAKDPQQTKLIAAYGKLVEPLAQRVIGRVGGAFSRETNASGAFSAGQLIADAQLAATAAPEHGGAVIAFANSGSVRTALQPETDGTVRYGQVFAMQPFSNNLVTLTLTGEQIRQLLEQQWRDDNSVGEFLQVSSGFNYRWAAGDQGKRVVPGSLTLHGKPLQPDYPYRVTVNSFLAAGGGGLRVLLLGRDRKTGMLDVDALEQYLAAHPGLTPSALDRIQH
ncbi:MAG: 5'-nucleotidase C-terminal domain-containing protein [Betaproteobacteria bacterium]|nr:5'-nucleotidase C-terminal domain-containing protein [Betaproteobacteria bacterium]